MTQKLSADFGRRIFGGSGSTRLQNFGTAGAVPSELTPNKFGAQEKIRHQPLAEASGMSSLRTRSNGGEGHGLQSATVHSDMGNDTRVRFSLSSLPCGCNTRPKSLRVDDTGSLPAC